MYRTFEKAFTIAMLFYLTGAFMPVVTDRLSGFSGFGASGTEFLIQAAFYSVALCFIGMNWRSVAEGAWSAKWILALLVVAFASTAWSEDPSITLRRAVVLCATTAFGIYFAKRYSVAEQLVLLAWTCALVICASFVCSMFLPQYGIDHTFHPGDWQGAFHQKNMLARAMVLACLVFLFARFKSGNVLRWVGIGGSIALLCLSRSVTGVVVFAVILGLWPLYRLLRTRFTFAVPVVATAGTVLLGAAVYAYRSLPALLEVINRNQGLSGRISLWNAVWFSISRQPWLGYGFDAFWQGMHGESANVLLAVGWSPEYAHNGFLDLILEMGFVGLAVFAVGYFALWRRALIVVSRDSSPGATWLCMYLAFMLFYNLTEGPVVAQNNITWVLYVATAVSLAFYMPVKRVAEDQVTS
jgi:O-antigen ligase